MSTCMTGFKSFFRVVASFCITCSKIIHNQHKVESKYLYLSGIDVMETCDLGMYLLLTVTNVTKIIIQFTNIAKKI